MSTKSLVQSENQLFFGQRLHQYDRDVQKQSDVWHTALPEIEEPSATFAPLSSLTRRGQPHMTVSVIIECDLSSLE
jgi:hypothetical protein